MLLTRGPSCSIKSPYVLKCPDRFLANEKCQPRIPPGRWPAGLVAWLGNLPRRLAVKAAPVPRIHYLCRLMRLLSLFFACYFAFLSCMGCTDEAVVCQDQAQSTVAAAAHSDYNADAMGDWCSPLCQCQCCGAVVVALPDVAAVAYPQLVEWGSSPQHGRPTVRVPMWALGSVWQPPQA